MNTTLPATNRSNAGELEIPEARHGCRRRAALRLGGLWLKNRDGESWLEGDFFGNLRITIHRNNRKTGKDSNQPDYEMFLNKKYKR
jgi:hypothetical protein